MKIINPTFAIVDPIPLDGSEILRQIEQVARICYKSEDQITKGSAEKLIEKLISRGHHAMLEFGPSITVNFVCNRGFTHELVRHRLASFAQESTRYCNYYNKNGEITVINPLYFKDTAYKCWKRAMAEAEHAYLTLIQLGKPPQEARGVLPIDLKTEINIKANIREWRHILKLRTAKAAHPQMRQLMCPLLDEFKDNIPILFDDIIYFHMDPLRIIQKLVIEITDQKVFDAYFVRDRLVWVFVAGWEEGLQHCSKRKPVMQMDQYGNVIKVHRSLKDAGRTVGADGTSIKDVCKGKMHSCRGFYWRYVESPEQIKEIIEGWQEKL